MAIYVRSQKPISKRMFVPFRESKNRKKCALDRTCPAAQCARQDSTPRLRCQGHARYARACGSLDSYAGLCSRNN